MTNLYSAGLMSQSFWFIEFKKLVSAVKAGRAADEIKTLCVDENWFGAVNSYRSKRMYGYIINRVKSMDDDLIDIFISSDVATQKLIDLICIMKTDRLFFEFVYEIYREKIILGNDEISTNDVSMFFVNKANQYDEISAWKDSTIKHLKSTYMNFLTESGLAMNINNNKAVKQITPPFIDTILESYLNNNNDLAVIKALTGVN